MVLLIQSENMFQLKFTLMNNIHYVILLSRTRLFHEIHPNDIRITPNGIRITPNGIRITPMLFFTSYHNICVSQIAIFWVGKFFSNPK